MKKLVAVLVSVMFIMNALGTLAESAQNADAQKLDASYTLALNAIGAEDYEKAKKYIDICFVYCDREANPVMYADLLLKRACIDVIEGDNDMALFSLDAALRVDPELADAYLVRTQVYTSTGDLNQAVANLEKYIKLSKDTSMYETVAQLHEASGNSEAASAAYDKKPYNTANPQPGDSSRAAGLFLVLHVLLEESQSHV